MFRVVDKAMVLVAASGGLLMAMPVLAQSRLDEVVVTGERIPLDTRSETGSRLGLTLRETPATIDVLTEEQLVELGLRDTLEALNRVPGVTSANPATSPGMLSARGFSGGAVSLLYDGARPGVPAFFTRVIDSWSFERIEVLKGPSSVVHGEGALAGAVNLIPKSARLDSRASATQLSYGSFDSVRLAADSNLPLNDRAALRGVASYSRSAGYVDDTNSEFAAASVSGLWKPIDQLTLNLAVDYSRDDYDTAYFGTPLVPRAVARKPSDLVESADGRVLDEAMRDVNFNVRDGIVDSDTVWVRSGAEYRFNEAWSLRNDLDVYRSDRRFINAEYFGYNAGTNRVDRSTGIVTHDFDYWTERLALAGDFKFGALRNRITLGAEFSEVDFFTRRRFGSTTSVDPYSPDRGRFPDGDDATIFPSRADNDNAYRDHRGVPRGRAQSHRPLAARSRLEARPRRGRSRGKQPQHGHCHGGRQAVRRRHLAPWDGVRSATRDAAVRSIQHRGRSSRNLVHVVAGEFGVRDDHGQFGRGRDQEQLSGKAASISRWPRFASSRTTS